MARAKFKRGEIVRVPTTLTHDPCRAQGMTGVVKAVRKIAGEHEYRVDFKAVKRHQCFYEENALVKTQKRGKK